MHGMMMGPDGIFNIQTGATYWFNSLSVDGGTSLVMTTPRGIHWYQDGKTQYARRELLLPLRRLPWP